MYILVEFSNGSHMICCFRGIRISHNFFFILKGDRCIFWLLLVYTSSVAGKYCKCVRFSVNSHKRADSWTVDCTYPAKWRIVNYRGAPMTGFKLTLNHSSCHVRLVFRTNARPIQIIPSTTEHYLLGLDLEST